MPFPEASVSIGWSRWGSFRTSPECHLSSKVPWNRLSSHNNHITVPLSLYLVLFPSLLPPYEDYFQEPTPSSLWHADLWESVSWETQNKTRPKSHSKLLGSAVNCTLSLLHHSPQQTEEKQRPPSPSISSCTSWKNRRLPHITKRL